MSTYQSEEEQLQALKKWWDDSGWSTVTVLALALSAVFGWRYWQNQTAAKIDAGALAYSGFLQQAAKANASPDDVLIAQALHAADGLKDDYRGSGYSYFAAFFKARQAVADKDYALAETELSWVLEHSSVPAISEVARLRLARVLFLGGQSERALEALHSGDGSSFAHLYAELEGDIHLSRQAYQAAYEAYLRAQSQAKSLEISSPATLTAKIQYANSYL